MKSKIISILCLSIVTCTACTLCGCHTGQTGSGETLGIGRDVQFSANDEGSVTLPDDCTDGDCPDGECPEDERPDEGCPEKQPPRRHRRGRRTARDDKKRSHEGKAPEFTHDKPIPKPAPLPAPGTKGNAENPQIKQKP
ncbi:MAG: hypothetical protein ACI4L9_01960 [Candidatus Coproplasma sp.]